MEALRRGSAGKAEEMAPAAEAAHQHHHPRQGEDRESRRGKAGDGPAAVAQEERAVELGEEAEEPAGVVGAEDRPGRRVDGVGCGRSVGGRDVGDHVAGRGPDDALDLAERRGDGRDVGDREARLPAGGGRSLDRGVHREHRAGDRHEADENGGREGERGVDAAEHRGGFR